MTILLLLLIYLVFISLGLPDSLLGSSFPAIAENLAISVDHAGYIGMTVSLFTILSSAFSDKLVEKLSTKVMDFHLMVQQEKFMKTNLKLQTLF